MTLAVWWIRRDLRLGDNSALDAARSAGHAVAPVYILDPFFLDAPDLSPRRLAFLLDGLRCLEQDLLAIGSRLILRRGPPTQVLPALFAEISQNVTCPGIFAEEDTHPYARQRDAQIQDILPLTLMHGVSLQPTSAVRKADGQPYTHYSPFRRRWMSLAPPVPSVIIPPPEKLNTPATIPSEPIPTEPVLPEGCPFQPGESEALRRLTAFTAGRQAALLEYHEQRDNLTRRGTSELSPYLRFGMLSARQAYCAGKGTLEKAGLQQNAWLDELIWRDFYLSVLWHNPNVLRESFRPALRDIPWENDRDIFSAWCEGQTGYPVVDAAMRQLRTIGWMHNRARMIVASFLAKDLLVDWRWGERWFMQHLLDGEPASNNGGWQWAAGTGTDAAPYFRVFNPTLQGKRFDPAGDFVRSWVPELSDVPIRYVHTPWEMSPHEMEKAGCVIGRDYPAPIVNHQMARKRALAAYRSSAR